MGIGLTKSSTYDRIPGEDRTIAIRILGVGSDFNHVLFKSLLNKLLCLAFPIQFFKASAGQTRSF